MKFTAIIFIVVLLAFSSVSAQVAQKDEILADGKAPLTQSMFNRVANFFEWTLEVKFSPAERAEFQNRIVENWKKEDAQEIQGVLYVIELSRELEKWDETERREAQFLIKERFLEELERNESNKINALLLGSYRQKHSVIDSSSTAVKQ
jgi:hypothetical protein